ASAAPRQAAGRAQPFRSTATAMTRNSAIAAPRRATSSTVTKSSRAISLPKSTRSTSVRTAAYKHAALWRFAMRTRFRARSRAIILAMACLVATPVAADQWDELAQKFIDQEHAHFVRRGSDKDGVVIVMEHPLITQRVVLVVMDGKPALSFQFKSGALPGDDALELVARGGKLVTGKDASLVMRALRQCFKAAGTKDTGVEIVSSDGLTVSCIVPHDGGGLSFVMELEGTR